MVSTPAERPLRAAACRRATCHPVRARHDRDVVRRGRLRARYPPGLPRTRQGRQRLRRGAHRARSSIRFRRSFRRCGRRNRRRSTSSGSVRSSSGGWSGRARATSERRTPTTNGTTRTPPRAGGPLRPGRTSGRDGVGKQRDAEGIRVSAVVLEQRVVIPVDEKVTRRAGHERRTLVRRRQRAPVRQPDAQLAAIPSTGARRSCPSWPGTSPHAVPHLTRYGRAASEDTFTSRPQRRSVTQPRPFR